MCVHERRISRDWAIKDDKNVEKILDGLRKDITQILKEKEETFSMYSKWVYVDITVRLS